MTIFKSSSILYILLLSCFIIGVSYYNTYFLNKESFYSSQESIILLGDSILKNNQYVREGNGIDDILIERTNEKTYCYAEDGSIIVDVYSQLDKISIDLNKETTTIYISVGGNNILTHYVDKEGDITETSILTKLFSSYKNLITSIQTKMNRCKIVLLDIYYPQSSEYAKFYSIIDEWNHMIYDYANDQQNHISDVLKVSQLLTQHNDFSHSIEPSLQGGKKIAEYILSPYLF